MRSKLVLLLIILLSAFLRFYRLDVNPPGLYWDEAVFGYDAYSVLQTGQDHHGATMPLFFESFGDWKLPVYHYLLVPSVAVFGLNEWGVRFPSALLGTLTVGVMYLLVSKSHLRGVFQSSPGPHLEGEKPGTGLKNVALLAAFFLAISPWHIQFSRGGFESTAGLFFVVTGTYLFLSFLTDPKTKSRLAFFLPAKALAAAGLLTLSMYSYHAYRIFTPLLIIAILLLYRNQVIANFKKLILPAFLSLLLLIPLINFTFTEQGRARAASQSAFSPQEVENKRIDYDQKSKKPLRALSKYLYSEPLYFAHTAFGNYLDHFSPVFLFFKGDQIGRHSQVDMGQIYAFEAILLIGAILAFKKMSSGATKLMLVWLLLAPIPAMIVSPTPHAYRTLQMAVPLAFFSAVGLTFWWGRLVLPVKIAALSVMVFSVAAYGHLIFSHYPQKFAADWQDGYKPMVAMVQEYQDQYEKVYVTNVNQTPYIYLLFYQKYDPRKFIEERGTREAFGKYVFVKDQFDIKDRGNALYVAPSWEKVDGQWLAAANDTAGRHIYSLWELR